MIRPKILLLCLTFFSAFQSSVAASAAEWRERSVYQVMTDRFARPDGSITSPCSTNDRVYCGGSWRGLIDKLSYISGMGFTAIWISPIVEQIGGNTGEGEAYHGYWSKNIYALNPKFGTEQDLKDLIAAVHALKMYIMVDVVVNHYANQGEKIVYSDFVPFNDSRYFHPKCDIDWGNQTSIEICWMGNGYLSLPDLNTEDQTVVDTLERYMASLVINYKIDGLRLDASRNIRKPFWTKLCLAAGVYCQGEVWVRDPEIICPYQEYMDGLHNYPIKEAATSAFTSSAGNMSDLVSLASQMQSRCRDITLFGTFMENHDNPRLGSFTTDIARLKNLAALNILADGVPVVYYGQEQALTGSNDPANREALWLTGFATTNNLVPTFTSLNRFRNRVVRTSPPFLTTLAKYTLLSSSVITVRKGKVVLVLTNSGNGVVTNMVVDGFSRDLDLVEVLSCSESRADGTGRLPVVLKGEPMALYPKSLLVGSGICGL
ncbi:glycoside hydrolase family 13 protein [Mycena rosella]|uniref:alpha-amylase n=1 Tax=Mycena rosella TaxID=1033263 RepID=A0AAD7BXX8_MYCRO|nr:glycoside hydrolase family 13 protein [Mycena rosella]